MERTSEARALLDGGHGPPLGQPPDILSPAIKASRGGVLEPEQLYSVGVHLETALRVRRYLSSLADRAPKLASLGESLTEQPELTRNLLNSFDEDGRIADSASGELADLRLRVAQLHDNLKDRVNGLLSDPLYEGKLQDDFFTIREERYVLPVKSGHKNHVEGIVHGWSGSGATVFIEPQPVVEANNKLLLAQADIDREIRRILTRLSRQVGGVLRELKRSVEALNHLDLSMASGRFSKELEAHEPVIAPGGLHLKAARHPLLVLSDIRVIPNDIALSAEQNVLVVTGPNTGGKTVALKTTGVCTLMALAGLHIPAEAGSQVPPVPGVHTDIGDEQSIHKSHSTFSGHIANIKAIFNEVEPGALVLLDELVVGTDPLQGAALAQSILEAFSRRRSLVLVTTHYQSLKVLPFQDSRFRNGAVGFDTDKQLPTYKLHLDVPGASSALQTARRLGLEGEIVERAAELAGPEQRQLEVVIARLESEAATLEEERRIASKERRKLQAARTQAEALERRLKLRLKEGLARERSEALQEARRLRDELKKMRRKLREPRRLEEVERDQRRAEGIAQGLAQQEAAARERAAGPALKPSQLRIGQKIFVVSLDTQGELLSLPDSRGRCEVRAGIMTLHVEARDLRRSKAQAQAQAPRRSSRQRSAQTLSWEEAQPQVPDNTVDVRGMRAEEAVDRVETFLDTLYERDRTTGYIIHGHGTGALKKRLREWLPKSRYISDLRPGQRGEGGDGVTAVLLK